MMTIIDCTTQPEHRVIYGICTTPIPDGWAVIPEGMTLPGVLAYADITTEERDGLPTVTAITPRPDLVAQAEAAAAAAQEDARAGGAAAGPRGRAGDREQRYHLNDG